MKSCIIYSSYWNSQAETPSHGSIQESSAFPGRNIAYTTRWQSEQVHSEQDDERMLLHMGACEKYSQKIRLKLFCPVSL